MSSPTSAARPSLGSPAIYYPTPPENVTVSPSTCLDIQLFKQVIKEYRKTDDGIIIGLNRSLARARDERRASSVAPISNPSGLPEDGGCAAVFQDIVNAWTHRAVMLQYCTEVVSKLHHSPPSSPPIDPTAVPSSSLPPNLDPPFTLNGAKPYTRPEKVYNELKIKPPANNRQVDRSEAALLQHRYDTEKSVEAIVRQRSLAAFKSRCRFFSPAADDLEGQRWWNAADKGI